MHTANTSVVIFLVFRRVPIQAVLQMYLVLFTPDCQVWQSDVNQVRYICQAVILTTVTYLHLTDVLSFHLAKQQYLLMKAAIFTRNRCTIDRRNIG